MDSLSCSVCKFVAYSKPHLDEHLLDHYSPKKFKCDKCFYFYCRTQDMLDEHVRLYHTEFRKFRCTECSYSVNSYHRLTVHLKRGCWGSENQDDDDGCEGTSTGRKEKGYRYSSKFRKYDSFKLYSRPHLNAAPYPTATVTSRDAYLENKDTLTCYECGYPAGSKESLESHRRLHDLYKPYECKKCSYKDFDEAKFNEHVKSHSEEGKLRCGICNYTTNHRHELKLHLEIFNHFAEMPSILDDSNDHDENDQQLSEGAIKAEFNDHVRNPSEEGQLLGGACDYATNYHHEFNLHLQINNHFTEMRPISEESPVHNENDQQHSEEVNTAEVNDHVSSPSEGFKFRCGDCEYATNHRHALKMHLKRNKHIEEVVLISDNMDVHQENDQQISEVAKKTEVNGRAKSQSEGFKFGCGDCEYATNHHHAFQLHLKRNKHLAELTVISDHSDVQQENVHQLQEDDDVIEIIEF